MPLLVADGLSHAQSGAPLWAFVLPRILATVPVGMLARRFGDHRVLTAGSLVWARRGVLIAIAIGFGATLVMRALSGVGSVTILIFLIKMAMDCPAGPMLSIAPGIIVASWPFDFGLRQSSYEVIPITTPC